MTKVKVKATSFKLVRDLKMINGKFKCNGKIPKGSILKLIFSKFKGQFDLKGQGHPFLKINQRPLDHQYTAQV